MKTECANPDAITWLEDPTEYTYLREMWYMSLSSRFPVTNFTRKFTDAAKLVGYVLAAKDPGKFGRSIYHWQCWWLKKHDRDLMPDGVYTGPTTYGGKMPVEAVNPQTLVRVDVKRGGDAENREGS